MAVVGGMGAGMEVVVDRHAGQSQGVGRMLVDAGAFPVCEVNTLIAHDHTSIQVCSSGQGRVRIDLSSWIGLNMGCHKKALVHCPCSRLAAFHGAPRMLC